MTFSSLRLAVTGLNGQVVSALIERAPKSVEIIALGRPQLELSARKAVMTSLRHAGCDAIINAAAYTQVDQAETEPNIAMRINGTGAANVAEAAHELQVPLLHLSTDYVFDGKLGRAYREDDLTVPVGAYGRSKLEGEKKIAMTYPNHVIVRTAWVFSPFGSNFVKTMLRLGRDRDEVSVVADQIGNPTSALDIADKLIEISRVLVSDRSERLRGIFHLSGKGDTTWAGLAETIFTLAAQNGRRAVRVRGISTSQYPTAAQRPLNSRLDNSKIMSVFGIEMPHWQSALHTCVTRLLSEENKGG